MRLFEEHLIRKVQNLNGIWSFKIDPQDVGEQNGWANGFADGQKIVVPSMWNNEQGLLTYEGAGWYQKEFYTQGGTLRFCFDGVMTQADIWLDGVKLGEHYGGFCEFSFIKENVPKGWHVLVVRADNRFKADSIPQKSVDWWHYGGINREIFVETLEGICVLYNRTEYSLSENLKRANGKEFVELYNAFQKPISDTLEFKIGEFLFTREVSLSGGEKTEIEIDFEIEDVHIWDTRDPYLYGIELQTSTDDLRDRTGFRKIEVKPDGIYLNHQYTEIRGVNRHEEHPEWGFAFPLKLMKSDLDIAFEMGCNSLRGSHYPNSRAFVDFCDECGMLFWSEIPIWGCGFAPETLGREKVLSRGLEMHREMVRYYYNHPCIIIWGMHNEIFSDCQQGYDMSALYYRYLKENGGNRLVTYATRMPLKDICMEFCDVICINLYKGWYEGELDAWDIFMEDFRAYRHQLGFDEKPVIFAEFGAAAIYGYKTFDDVRWTEEYQAKLLTHCIELFHKDPMVCGSYVWQFTDIRSANELGRARAFNNKGVLNEYRKPKAAYFAVKALYDSYKEER